jgi:integrase/recombinase XerD
MRKGRDGMANKKGKMGERLSLQSKGGRPLDDAFEQFIQAKTVMNVSGETIKHYQVCYKYFSEFFGEGRNCNEVTEQTIFDYLGHIRKTKPNIKQKTVSTYIRGLRTIFYFMMNNGDMAEFKITLPRVEETIKETYTEYEIQCLIKKPDIKSCTFGEYRNWTMVCYFIATGNRLGTVCNLKISDLNFRDEEILIRKTKNKKQQIIPMSSELKTILQEFLRFRKGEPDDWLFCTVYGRQLNRDSLDNAIYHYNRSRGVQKTSVHLFRHTFAKNWIMNGGDIFRLQKILGHSTLDMVKNYVAIYGGDLKRDYDRYSLLDQAKASSQPQSGQRVKMRK